MTKEELFEMIEEEFGFSASELSINCERLLIGETVVTSGLLLNDRFFKLYDKSNLGTAFK